MLIDHGRRFALVAVPKTGSTSMHYALSDAFGGVSFASRSVESAVYHLYASDIRAILGAPWEDYYTFAMVRNPYDRLVSLFHDFKHSRGMIKAQTFEEFAGEELEAWFGDVHFHPQLGFLAARDDDDIIVKNVARYETGVQEVFEGVCRDLSVSSAGQVGHARKSDRRSYLDYYSSRTVIDVVNTLYRRDFEAFGYDMM